MGKLIDYICIEKLKCDVPSQTEYLKVIKHALNMIVYNNGSNTHKDIVNQLNFLKKNIKLSPPDQFFKSKFLTYLSNTSYNHSNTPVKPSKIFVPENELLTIKNICHTYPQFQLFAFGSRVKGTHRPNSDLDIACKIIKPIKFYYTEFCNMEDEIKSKITSIPIDIIILDLHSETFKKLIEDDLVLIP